LAKGCSFRVFLWRWPLEYEEVLKRGDLLPGLTEEDVDRFLDYLFQSSHMGPSVHSRRPRLSDPDDELVMDLAAQQDSPGFYT